MVSCLKLQLVFQECEIYFLIKNVSLYFIYLLSPLQLYFLISYRLLNSPTRPVIEALGKKLSFEIAVGLNGRVWVNATAPRIVIIVANAIMNSESLSGTQQRIMVEKLLAIISD